MNKGQTIDFTYLGYHEITNGMVHYMFHYIVDVKPYHTTTLSDATAIRISFKIACVDTRVNGMNNMYALWLLRQKKPFH